MSEFSLEICQPTEDQARLILSWRNDPDTCANSLRARPRTWEDFWPDFRGDYFRNPKLPPMFVTEKGQRVAYLGFQQMPHPLGEQRLCSEISVMVAPEQRSRGIGAAALQLAATFLRSAGYDDALATIRAENKASLKIFERAGFVCFEIASRISESGTSMKIVRSLLRLNPQLRPK